MPPQERDVVKPPNLDAFSSSRAANGFLPLTRSASPTAPPNMSRLMHGDPGGSADLTRLQSPVNPPNAGIFKDGDRGYTDENAPAAVQPGQGAIPVNPGPNNPFIGTAAFLGIPRGPK